MFTSIHHCFYKRNHNFQMFGVNSPLSFAKIPTYHQDLWAVLSAMILDFSQLILSLTLFKGNRVIWWLSNWSTCKIWLCMSTWVAKVSVISPEMICWRKCLLPTGVTWTGTTMLSVLSQLMLWFVEIALRNRSTRKKLRGSPAILNWGQWSSEFPTSNTNLALWLAELFISYTGTGNSGVGDLTNLF